jgi:hypothetical protein
VYNCALDQYNKELEALQNIMVICGMTGAQN